MRKHNPSFKIEGNFKNVRFECIFRVTVLRDKQNDTSCNKTNKEHTVWPYKLYKCTSIKYPQNIFKAGNVQSLKLLCVFIEI